MGHHDTNKPTERWQREQWASDDDAKTDTEHKPTWDRHHWASDNPGTSPDTIGGTGADPDRGDRVESADMDHISGRGMPSGESHWERVEDKD
jgi:hypothetical protein